jgi:hypothetical protein
MAVIDGRGEEGSDEGKARVSNRWLGVRRLRLVGRGW